jgi:hypothetical protein
MLPKGALRLTLQSLAVLKPKLKSPQNSAVTLF